MRADFERYADEVERGLIEDAAISDKPQLTTISAADLQQKTFQPLIEFVHGLIVPGLTILASPPKYGKSWLCLDMCISVSRGSLFLGYRTTPCTCLYLALEDSEQRLHNRLARVLSGTSAPGNCFFATYSHTTSTGLLDELASFVGDHPETGIIVLDTLQKIRGAGFGREGTYSADYREMSLLKNFADEHHVALVLVHHLRKATDETDTFARISGTTAITGAADTMVTLAKDNRNADTAVLSATGRDIESLEIELRFDKDCCIWMNQGDTDELAEQRTRDEFNDNPIVRTIRKLLKQSTDHTWSGTATDLMNAGMIMVHSQLAPTTRDLAKRIVALDGPLAEWDGILHTTTGNGNAGKKHHFYHRDSIRLDFEQAEILVQ